MEQRSPWVPAELAPFFSQHHKWSWSRPEQSTVRLPLCADSIRNNCILASLHSSPLHHRGLTLYCIFCVVGYSKDPERGEGHCSIVFFLFFFNSHMPLNCTGSCTEAPLMWRKKSLSQQHLVLGQPQPLWSSSAESNLKCCHYITSCKKLAWETLKCSDFTLSQNSDRDRWRYRPTT